MYTDLPTTPVSRSGPPSSTTPPPLRRPNPRKRSLPVPSPVAAAFADFATRPFYTTRRTTEPRDTDAFAFGGPSVDATPFAPLLPPAPIFDVLPLPDTPVSPVGPRSSPMKRSPAIASMAQFTSEAQREAAGLEEQDKRRWIANSFSNFDLGARYRQTTTSAAPFEHVEEEESGPVPDFHLELSSPDLAPLRNLRSTGSLIPSFDDNSALPPDCHSESLSGMSWSSSLPSLSPSSSTSSLSSFCSRSPSPLTTSDRSRSVSPATELIKALSLKGSTNDEPGVSALALRRFEKRQRGHVVLSASPSGLGLTLHP